MGGGDLNMKKSWHPQLIKNQERVWLEEKKALEEKKKLDQLRKEKDEERQLQELQRLQEEQTGRKRTEKLEWMYATPATGSSVNKDQLEDYLLGKKRVDKMLIADENEKIGAAHKNFIAVQNANTARDIASKIREDPLLAIKQQEQASYQSLMSNPLRLKAMQMRNGVLPSKDKKDKKDKKKKDKKEKKHKHRREASDDDGRLTDRSHRHSRSPTPDRYRIRGRRDSRSPPRDYDRRDSERGRSRSPQPLHNGRYDRDGYSRRRSFSRPQRSMSPRARSPDRRGRSTRYPNSAETSEEEVRQRNRSRSPDQRRHSDSYDRKHRRSLTPPAYGGKRARVNPPSPRRHVEPSRPNGNGYSTSADDRAARLAAMSQNASAMTADRKDRLKTLLEAEKAELEEDERRRAKSGGMGSFLSAEQKKVFSAAGGLEDRLRRGRAGLVAEAE